TTEWKNNARELEIKSIISRGFLQCPAHVLQVVSKRRDCELITHMRGGSKSFQAVRTRDAVADRGCNACRTRFVKNDSIDAVLHDFATILRSDNGQAMRLRFQLRNGKSIRERRKNEYVDVSVKFSCLHAGCRAKPLNARGLRDCFGVRDFYRSNHPEFNGLITQNPCGLQQSGDAFAEIN